MRGSALTPYLLGRINEATQGRSYDCNLTLLENNARIAGEMAGCLSKKSFACGT